MRGSLCLREVSVSKGLERPVTYDNWLHYTSLYMIIVRDVLLFTGIRTVINCVSVIARRQAITALTTARSNNGRG